MDKRPAMRIVWPWVFAVLISVACAGGAKDPSKLVSCGAWEMLWAGQLVAFYAASPALPESALLDLARAEAKATDSKWERVILYINFDEKLAKSLASPKTLERVSKTGMGLSDMEVWNGKTMGGGRLTWTRKDGKEEWKYQPPPPSR